MFRLFCFFVLSKNKSSLSSSAHRVGNAPQLNSLFPPARCHGRWHCQHWHGTAITITPLALVVLALDLDAEKWIGSRSFGTVTGLSHATLGASEGGYLLRGVGRDVDASKVYPVVTCAALQHGRPIVEPSTQAPSFPACLRLLLKMNWVGRSLALLSPMKSEAPSKVAVATEGSHRRSSVVVLMHPHSHEPTCDEGIQAHSPSVYTARSLSTTRG